MNVTRTPLNQPATTFIDSHIDLYQHKMDNSELYCGPVAEDPNQMWRQARHRFAVSPWCSGPTTVISSTNRWSQGLVDAPGSAFVD